MSRRVRQPFTGSLYPPGHFTPETVEILLLLVDDFDISIEAIAGWDYETREQVGDWAYRVHLRASDNRNRVPAKPEILNQFPKAARPESLGEGTVMDLAPGGPR